jgi:uncharacterized DUF497 family protein
VRYEWDRAKAAANRRKHGIDFKDALPALEDPNRLEGVDERWDYGEERVITIGLAWQEILFVVTTMRGDDTCRLISARRATRHEEDRYYAGDLEG